MQKGTPVAADPDAYVAALSGWRARLVVALRDAVRAAAPFDEVIKWGHLVYSANGPVLLIRAEESRVLFGFWRGRRLRQIEPRLKPAANMRWRPSPCWRARRSTPPSPPAWPPRPIG